MEPKRERIARLDRYLLKKGISANQLEVVCHLSRGTLSKARSGKTDIGLVSINKILAKFKDLDRIWLMTGEGNMLKTAKNVSTYKTIKYYPNVNGSTKGLQFIEDSDETYIELDLPFFKDCSLAIKMPDSSMEPLIGCGQIILLSEWKEDFIDWEKIYMVASSDGGYNYVRYLLPSGLPMGKNGALGVGYDSRYTGVMYDLDDPNLRLFIVRGCISDFSNHKYRKKEDNEDK